MRLRVACQLNTKHCARGNKQVTIASGLPTCRNLELFVRCASTCPLTNTLIYCSAKRTSVLCDGTASGDYGPPLLSQKLTSLSFSHLARIEGEEQLKNLFVYDEGIQVISHLYFGR
jgi:hypothetical protein